VISLIKLCGIRCKYYLGMGHIKDKCWKCGNEDATNNIYLEVMVDDEKVMWC
jgi:hypothetical protein